MFHAPDGAVRVVFVTSDAARSSTAILLASDTARSLRDALTGERIAVANGRASIALPAGAVRMLIVD